MNKAVMATFLVVLAATIVLANGDGKPYKSEVGVAYGMSLEDYAAHKGFMPSSPSMQARFQALADKSCSLRAPTASRPGLLGEWVVRNEWYKDIWGHYKARKVVVCQFTTMSKHKITPARIVVPKQVVNNQTINRTGNITR